MNLGNKQYCPRLLQFPRMRMTPERRFFGSPMQCNQRNTCRKCRFTVQLLPPARASNNSDERRRTRPQFRGFFHSSVAVLLAPKEARPGAYRAFILLLAPSGRCLSHCFIRPRQNIRAATRSCPLRYTLLKPPTAQGP